MNIKDPSYTASSDHPGMILTNTPFNGSNFHGWSRNIKMDFGAKLKLGFIEGSYVKIASDHDDLQRWIRCYYMVTCWILNSMVTELSDAFLYAQSACELWKEIRERYGQSNGLLVYQLEIELSKISQGSSVEQCFERLGYPDWYKGKKAKKNNRLAAHVNSGFNEHLSGETPFDMGYENEDLTTNQIVAVGKGSKNLYICKPTLDQATSDAQVFAFCKTYQNVIPIHCFNKNAFSNYVSKHSIDIKTFHERLDHTSISKLVHIPQYKHLDVSSFSYECCLLSKHHRFPFQRSTFIAKNPFDLIHVDLWGPFEHPAQDGAHYFYTIVDDLTRATWTYLVHCKTQVYDLLVTFLAYVTNHFKTSVKIIRSDNGTEIVNDACNSLFISKGILHQSDVVFKEDVFPFKDSKKPKKSLFVHDFPSFEDELYPETTQTPLPPDPAVVIPNVPILPEPDNENSGNENFDSSTNSIPQNVNSIPPKPTRRSTRQSTRPVWLKDFIAPTSIKSGPYYPLFASTDFPGIPQQHIAFLANVFAQPEPTRFQQDIQHPGWVEAMNKELKAMEKNNTWTLTELPSGHKAITSKWVYKTNFKPTGIIERLKARLVVRGFNQKEGLNYKHTFSPVAKLSTIRVLIAIATAKEWPLHQVDINNAFLRGFNDKEIYMLPLEGYTKAKPGQDYSLFVKVQGDSFTAALVYADDVLITGNTSTETDSLQKSLDDKFTIKDLGLAKYFLDISYVVQHLSQFVSSPKDVHLQAAIHLLKYLKGTASKGLFYHIQPHLQVTGFTDVDWASYLMTRKLLTGYCRFLGHSLVSWKTKKQATLSRSSTEAEHKSMATTTCELLWLSFLLKDIYIPVKLPITLFCDNKSAQQIAANPCFHEKTKHMDIDSHFTREKVPEDPGTNHWDTTTTRRIAEGLCGAVQQRNLAHG
nr:hypothetical protein [Tanacetum cinerariifolium]